MAELLLALDIGTTTARALVFSPAAEVLGLARAPLTSANPGPGLVEQDPAAVWRAARRVMVRALAEAGRAPADLAAIGLTTQRTSIVIWDRLTGRPVGPMVVWSDLRGAGRAAELLAAGYFLAPQQAATKLEAVVAALDVPLERLAWGALDAFLIHRLTGGAVHATDRSQAWPTGYLDLATMGWNQALIEHQGLGALRFPTLVDSWGDIGLTSAAVVGAAVPVAADLADQQSALLAHGECAKITYGTSATLDLSTGTELMFRSPLAPPFVLSSVAGQTRFCVEGMVLSAGSALDWLRGACGLGGHARFEALAASVADTAGAAFLPALQGLGAPHGDAARRGSLTGLTPAVSPAHLARAGLEGVAFRVREAFEFVYALTGAAPPEAIGVDGGLTANAGFLRIQADLLGRPLRRHAIREATAAGAALAAGRGEGLLTDSDIAAFTRYREVVEPAIGADESAARFDAWRARVHP